MPSRLQPAFWGGLFIGVLSSLPFVNAGNCCCCLWVVSGGVLAAYLHQQNSPVSLPAAEGALVGLLAGAIGGVIGTVLSIPLQMLAGPMQQQFVERILASNPEVTPEMREMLERFATGTGMRAAALLVSIVVNTVFGMLGGLLGVAIFRRKLPPTPPAGTVEILPPE